MSTKIEWATDTLNPIIGCEKHSPGCANCYAERQAARMAAGRGPASVVERYRQVIRNGIWNGRQIFLPEVLDAITPRQRPALIFAGSMSDWFREIHSSWLYECFCRMRECAQHTFCILTKRPMNMLGYQRVEWHSGFPPNVWCGVSVESADYAFRIDQLRMVDCALRFVSFEPLLGPIEEPDLRGIGWVIVGAESGPGRRPCDMDWAHGIVAECEPAMPVFVKQLDHKGAIIRKGDPGWPEWADQEWPDRRTPSAQCRTRQVAHAHDTKGFW